MRPMIATILTALAIAAGGHAAQAGILASVDDPSLSTFTQDRNALWALDGHSETSLGFNTTKANETIQLSLAGFCGSYQSVAATGATFGNGFVQVFFMVDGKILGELGNANLLCVWPATSPANPGTVLGNTVITEQKMTVATPGQHSVKVLLQSQAPTNGSGMVPMFGQSHVTVSN